jgi:hypothetical protein
MYRGLRALARRVTLPRGTLRDLVPFARCAARHPRPEPIAGEMMAIEHQQNDHGLYPPKERSAVAARQGVVSGRVITVLLVSLLLAVVALGVSYWFMH